MNSVTQTVPFASLASSRLGRLAGRLTIASGIAVVLLTVQIYVPASFDLLFLLITLVFFLGMVPTVVWIASGLAARDQGNVPRVAEMIGLTGVAIAVGPLSSRCRSGCQPWPANSRHLSARCDRPLAHDCQCVGIPQPAIESRARGPRHPRRTSLAGGRSHHVGRASRRRPREPHRNFGRRSLNWELCCPGFLPRLGALDGHLAGAQALARHSWSRHSSFKERTAHRGDTYPRRSTSSGFLAGAWACRRARVGRS